MCLAASGAPVAVKGRAVNRSTKLKNLFVYLYAKQIKMKSGAAWNTFRETGSLTS
jgi:hypothetical protein